MGLPLASQVHLSRVCWVCCWRVVAGTVRALLALFVAVAIAQVCGFTAGVPGPFVTGVLGLLLACWVGFIAVVAGTIRCWRCSSLWPLRRCAGFIADAIRLLLVPFVLFVASAYLSLALLVLEPFAVGLVHCWCAQFVVTLFVA